ncbi:unnamed protein product, partial [Rotaria sp. Silwood1]
MDANPGESDEDKNDPLSSNVDQAIDNSVITQNDGETSMSKIRAVDKVLHDHAMSFYHDFEPFIDHSLTPHLFAYGFIKSYYNRVGKNNLPLYSGFMAIHLPHSTRPRHKVTFMPPIIEDPNKLETAEACLVEMKKLLIDNEIQNSAVLVVDERIFRLCTKVKDEHWLDFEGIFLYPGDFHMMKCAMIVIWGILEESGVDTLIGTLYKDATHRAILSVSHFNKSLRTIKLLYTALLILVHDQFFLTLPTTMIDNIEQLMNKMPTDSADVEEKKRWYKFVLDYLSNAKLQDAFDLWIKNNCDENLKFHFWTFVLFELITPLIKLYTALRTSNFSARNAAACELAELFFATNHRQYARLTARHLSDLRIWPEEILDHLSKSFAVSRSNRNFSSIALDQTIEATINKMGKGHGGITGRCSPDLIDIWSKSYTFRSLLSTITSELAGVESNFNSIESHIECSSSRMLADHVDLQIILDKLVEEKLFSLDTNNVTQLFTGIYSTYFLTTNQQQALVIDGSSLLHIYPRAGSNVFEYAIYLLVEHITPLFIDYSRIDIIFDSSRSQDLKSFIHRHSNKNTTQPKYDRIVRSSLLPTGKKYQNFVASNRAVLATAVIECWKDTEATEKLPLGSVLVLAGPLETAIKLEKDKQPMNMVELE